MTELKNIFYNAAVLKVISTIIAPLGAILGFFAEPKKTILHVMPLQNWGGTEQVLLDYVSATQDKYNHIVCSITPIADTARSRFSGKAKLISTTHKSYNPEEGIKESQEKENYDRDFRREIQGIAEKYHPDIAVGWTLESTDLCRNLTTNGWLLDFKEIYSDHDQRFSINDIVELYYKRHGSGKILPFFSRASRFIPIVGYEHYASEFRDDVDWLPVVDFSSKYGNETVISTFAFASDSTWKFHLPESGFSPDSFVTIEPGIDTKRFTRDEDGRRRLRVYFLKIKQPAVSR